MSVPPEQAKPDTPVVERRRAERTRDDAGWESKVVGRLNGRLNELPSSDDPSQLGWEASVLDVLRKRIEKGPA